MKRSIAVAFMAVIMIGCSVTAGLADLAPITVINPSSFNFNVIQYNYTGSGTNGLAYASGTSNGIGWSISDTNLWSGLTTTDPTFSFSALPIKTDNLHPSIDFTIKFDSILDGLLVVLSNDNLTDSINFGRAPTSFSGITRDGTQIVLDNNLVGGWALFTNLGSDKVIHVNTNGVPADGFNLAFHAFPKSAVPIPGAALLLGSGLLGLVGFRRTRTV